MDPNQFNSFFNYLQNFSQISNIRQSQTSNSQIPNQNFILPNTFQNPNPQNIPNFNFLAPYNNQFPIFQPHNQNSQTPHFSFSSIFNPFIGNVTPTSLPFQTQSQTSNSHIPNQNFILSNTFQNPNPQNLPNFNFQTPYNNQFPIFQPHNPNSQTPHFPFSSIFNPFIGNVTPTSLPFQTQFSTSRHDSFGVGGSSNPSLHIPIQSSPNSQYSSSSNTETPMVMKTSVDSPVRQQGSKKKKRKGKRKVQMCEDLSEKELLVVKKLSLMKDINNLREKELMNRKKEREEERQHRKKIMAIEEKELQIQAAMKEQELQTQKYIKEMEINAKKREMEMERMAKEREREMDMQRIAKEREREMDLQILNADTSTMSERRQTLHEIACKKIINKWFT
ncbi:uncharacterized protein DS421_16g529160 [Arachis hypogaea]|nr:uncharacterized protein DS421_16g529160 [Arachis hypogaea]